MHAAAIRLNTRAITADDRLEAAFKNMRAVAGHIQPALSQTATVLRLCSPRIRGVRTTAVLQ
jgi:hypothetical protein